MAEETHESRMVVFRKSWEDTLPVVRQLIPSHITPERIFSIAVTARQRNPELLECTDRSILRGIIIGAQLGLDVSGVGGKAYLVPFKNKNTGQLEAQFMPGYRGLMELARRTGQIGAIYGRVVYEGEEFAYEDGMVQRIHHIPSIGAGDPGKIVGVWVVAVWANGFRQGEVLSKYQIDKIRGASRAANANAWVNWYPEMALKSALKRLCKKLPDSAELMRALDLEDAVESGQPIIDVDLGEDVAPEPKPTRTESIVADIKRKPGRPPKAPVAPVAAPEVTEETDDMPDDADFEDDDEETDDDE